MCKPNKDRSREISRRALIKWSLAAGAALGVTRSKILDVLERSAGRGIAEAAGAMPNKRSVHIRSGNGGLAWFQLMWPQIAIAASPNARYAWHHPSMQKNVTGTDRPLTIAADTPFYSNAPNLQMTALMAGSNEQHTRNPTSIARSVASGSLFAIASVLQANTPSVIPVITVGDMDFGTAPNAPDPANVTDATGISDLFNSAASRAGHLLATGTHADLYRAQYATLAALNRASNLSTTRQAYMTGRSSAHFLGTNLASQLAITPADLTRYGVDPTSAGFSQISNDAVKFFRQDMLTNFASALATTAKAFAMGLTSSVVLPGMTDDPHDAWSAPGVLGTDAALVLPVLKQMLDAFMTDLANTTDSVTGARLADEVVITIEGDTPKDPLQPTQWLDATEQNSNWIYIYGGGALKTGWFGGLDTSQNVTGFDPATGAIAAPDANLQAQAAVAATAYAITRGDAARVQDFSRVDITGLVVPT